MSASLKWPVWPTRLAVVLLVLFMSMLSYLIWFEPPWLVYTNSPFPLEKMQLKRGEPMVFRVERCSTATARCVPICSATLRPLRPRLTLP